MRLTNYEIKSVKKTAADNFGSKAKVILFGSRVDNTQKGGDIDLYIIPEFNKNLFVKKMKFLIDLETKIGEQKIDVIIAKNKTRLIEQEALKTGIEL